MAEHSLIKYRNDITALITRARELKLSDTETDKVFEECFDELSKKYPINKPEIIIKQRSCSSFFSFAAKVTLFVLFLFLIPYILLNVHQPTSSVVLRNVQGLIYPGLKILRFFAVPIVKSYPSLTNLYDEACLVVNPFFYVSDMICWPCEDVHCVVDLTGFNNHSLYQSGIPFVVQTNRQHVNFEQLKHVYRLHKDVFLRDASDIKSNNSTLQSMDDIFDKHWDEGGTTHVSWRVNRMYPSQILRKLFPRPYFISDRLGQTVERFILIDEPAAEGYSFPDPECCYAFAIQGSGERTIILKPSKECGSVCRTVSVVLKPSFILWYNWWYWKPISLPKDNVTETSITYISSYC
ncbi:hypothetical protein RI129_007300 [Pyrocoelia pectoralis]|uniref:Uncharacterized protein n=1 Tax=Pyrocoelia pectoralis TaxID=417401 RepID=A0AAN7V7S6_9COLE